MIIRIAVCHRVLSCHCDSVSLLPPSTSAVSGGVSLDLPKTLYCLHTVP